VFFHFSNLGLISNASLFDNNAELMNVYTVVRDDVDSLIALLWGHKEKHSREHYYETRALDRQEISLTNVQRAARTIYLNKTCYNGLYRVNNSGQFNVPMGSYQNPQIVFPEILRAASKALQGATVDVRDFRTVLDIAQPGDFLYFDPPYAPLTKTANFTSYTAENFTQKDQEDLAAVFTELSKKNCLCMLSNSYTPLTRELYLAFRRITVYANRAINSNPSNRGSIKELLVVNY
jgi:DNA adenine methylase